MRIAMGSPFQANPNLALVRELLPYCPSVDIFLAFLVVFYLTSPRISARLKSEGTTFLVLRMRARSISRQKEEFDMSGRKWLLQRILALALAVIIPVFILGCPAPEEPIEPPPPPEEPMEEPPIDEPPPPEEPMEEEHHEHQ